MMRLFTPLALLSLSACTLLIPRVEGACGDGVLDAGEGCDDGNTLPGDGCNAACLVEGCGDGVLQPEEECDDGNLIDEDACTSACRANVCGDGVPLPGVFCEPAQLSVSTTGGVRGLALGDLNNDGRLDIATAQNNGQTGAFAYLQQQDGSFTAAPRLFAGTNPESVALGDLNQDGALDIVIGNDFGDRATIALQDPASPDLTFLDEFDLGLGSSPQAVALVDLDRDGALDLLSAEQGADDPAADPPVFVPGSLSVRRGDGLGGFGGRDELPAGAEARTLATRARPGNSIEIAVVSNTGGENLFLFETDNGGALVPGDAFSLDARPEGVLFAEIDGVGGEDLLLTGGRAENGNFGALGLLPGQGNGFDPAGFSLIDSENEDTFSVAVLDLDHDGDLDVVATALRFSNGASSNGRLLFFLNEGGTLALLTKFDVLRSPKALAVGDIDRDGHSDFVLGYEDDESMHVFVARP